MSLHTATNRYTNINIPKRNIGIDLLRIISMVYVVILHNLGIGGILANLQEGTTQYRFFWFMEIWCFCATNIFVMISGFVGYSEEDKSIDWARYITIWLEVVFYGAFISVIYEWIHPNTVGVKTIRNMFFPINNDIYWFFSGYTGVYLLKPFLNAAISKISKKRLEKLTLTTFLIFCIFSRISDPFRLIDGYSAIWMLILYLFGASIKKCEFDKRISIIKAFICLLGVYLITWIWKMNKIDFEFIGHSVSRDILISYTSPTITLAAALHIIIFSKLSSVFYIRHNKFTAICRSLITSISSTSLAIYIINTNPILWVNELENRFIDWIQLSTISILARIAKFTFAFILIVILVDLFRQYYVKRIGLYNNFKKLITGPDRINAISDAITSIFWILFPAIWIFLFWKCPYGYGNIDEALYHTVPYRLLKWGDGLLVHEWHEFQLSTFPMLPISWLYNHLFTGTEGIFLHYRFIYTFFWGCGCLFLFHRTKKYSRIGAALASISLLIYAPYGIMALSYNSMGILFLLNFCIIILTAKSHRKIQYIFSGFFLAGAILCCPYLISIYVLLSISTLLSLIHKQKKNITIVWFYITIGAAIIFVVFCTFLLSHADIKDIFESIPIVLDDIEHPDRSLISKSTQFIKSIMLSTPFTPLLFILFISICLISKKWKKTLNVCTIILCGITAVWILYFTFHKTHINYVMMPICLCGLFGKINSKDKCVQKLFRLIWLPGFIYTYCLNYSSNQGLYAISNASVVSAFSSILIFILFLHYEIKFKDISSNIVLIASVMLFLIQIGSELYLRYQNVFWENGINEQKVIAQKGPEKGIIMTQNHFDTYNQTLEELQPIIEDESIQQILFFTNDPVLYLCAEKSIGSFSSWLPGINDRTVNRLDLYYQRNPEKIPDAIYIPAIYSDYISHFATMGYAVEQTPDKNYILRQTTD